MKTMKNLMFLLVLVIGFSTFQATAQQIPAIIPIIASDTTSMSTNNVTRTFTKAITNLYLYNWSVAVKYVHQVNTADSCRCVLQESFDGINFSTIRDKNPVASKLYNNDPFVGKLFTATTSASTETYIWSGGEGPLPFRWVPNYLRVSCTHYVTGTSRPYVYLQLKK